MNDDSGEKRDDSMATTNSASTAEAKPAGSEVAAATGTEGSNVSPPVAGVATANTANAAPPTPPTVANAGAGTARGAATSTNMIRRILWLDERVAEARLSTFGQSQPGWAEYDAARHAREGVVQIGETGQSSWAVLLLERVTASLLLRAHAARAGIEITGPLSEADWQSVRKIPVVQEAWNNLSAVQVTVLAEALGADGDHATANLPVQQRKSFALGLHSFVKTLAEPLEFEANRLGRALFARYTRVAIAVVAVIVIVSSFSSWLGTRFEKPNIALHRPVEVSSQYPGAGEDHTLLVDGDRTNLGFHTNCEGPQFVVVDLGSVHKFDKVVVYNRDEFPERAIPLYLEVSTDHQNYKQIAVKKDVFDKWAATGLGAMGRYIRLRNTPPNCFHLAEVEVY